MAHMATVMSGLWYKKLGDGDSPLLVSLSMVNSSLLVVSVVSESTETSRRQTLPSSPPEDMAAASLYSATLAHIGAPAYKRLDGHHDLQLATSPPVNLCAL